MENYIVINGVRHDLMKQEGITCRECSLFDKCSNMRMPCSIFAGETWDTLSEYYFVLHSNY